MLIRSIDKIYLSACLSVGATLGGWAITAAFEGDTAAISFVYFSVPVMLATLFVQVALFWACKDRLRLVLIFNISVAFGAFWMMSCLVLPIFWISRIHISVKLGLSLFSLILFYANLAEGIEKFERRWCVIGQRALAQHYKADCGLVAWGEIVASLKLSVSIHVPGIPASLNAVLSTLLVGSMLAGLALRKLFPMFSIFAWSIPALVVIATLLQMVGMAIGQLLVLRELEKKAKQVIRLS